MELKSFAFYQFISGGNTGLSGRIFRDGKWRPSAPLRASGAQTGYSPRQHCPLSRVSNSYSIVFCSTGTILRRKSNGRGSEVERQKVKAECPEKSEELKRFQDSGINSNLGHPAGVEKRRVAHPFQDRKGRPPKRLLRIECATRLPGRVDFLRVL